MGVRVGVGVGVRVRVWVWLGVGHSRVRVRGQDLISPPLPPGRELGSRDGAPMSSVKLAAPCASHARRLAYRYVGSSANVVSAASPVAPPPAAPPPAAPPPPAPPPAVPPPAVLPTTTHATGASQSCLATLRRVPSSAISGLPDAARWLLTWLGLGLGFGFGLGLG